MKNPKICIPHPRNRKASRRGLPTTTKGRVPEPREQATKTQEEGKSPKTDNKKHSEIHYITINSNQAKDTSLTYAQVVSKPHQKGSRPPVSRLVVSPPAAQQPPFIYVRHSRRTHWTTLVGPVQFNSFWRFFIHMNLNSLTYGAAAYTAKLHETIQNR